MMPTPDEYESIRNLLRQTCGLVIGPEKEYLVRTRLRPILDKHQLKSYTELLSRAGTATTGPFSLSSSSMGATLRMEIVEAMTTKETSFFRDGHPFDEFERTLLREACDRAIMRTGKLIGLPPRIRIWSAACASGQESYSIGISIYEFLEKTSQPRIQADNFWILATDISNEAIARAKTGEYSEFDVSRGLSVFLRKKYFESTDAETWRANDKLRKLIDFQTMNITEPVWNLNGFDMVFCRNLLIYFDEATRFAVLERIHRTMLPDAVLILGSAENLPAAAQHLFTQRHLGKSVVFTRNG
jgi:chemotaxis protein methyltransferase CheR